MRDKTIKTMRVFISSTFKDMNEVRSYLAINVFPYIKRKFFKKGINFSWVDLRWGITNEEAQAGLVVPRCLQSINDCDVFVGIIGDYYGTIISRADVEALDLSEENKSQIINYLDFFENEDGISITEIEILHGVLNNRRNPNCCFFIKDGYKNKDSRINRLIERINQGGYDCHEYSTNEQLGRYLYNYLFDNNDNHQEEPDIIHKESKIQQAILESYLNDYHFDEEFEQTKDKLKRVKWDNDRGYFDFNRYYYDHNHAIAGEWGCGKTSYIANLINWVEKTREYNIVYYFINSSSSFNTPDEIANYLSHQILRIEEYKEKIKKSALAEKPIDRLHQLISLTHLHFSKPLVIVLDGIENLKDNTESSVYAKSLEWIGHVHPNVFLLISAEKEDYSISRFKDLKIDIQECPSLKDNVVKLFANTYLKRYHKTVNDNCINRIIGCSVLKNPLLLRRFLDLLISCDNNNSLEDTINTFTMATTRQDFISLYFKRLFTYFPNCYNDLLSYLSVSRNGLYGLELGVLLREKDGYMPTNRIMEICAMLDDFLVSSGVDNVIHTNCFYFFKNEVVKEAVCNNLVENDSISRYRWKIVEVITKDPYVDSYGDRIHMYSELLHQLYELKEYGHLYNNLLTPEFFLKMQNSDDYIKYWTTLYNYGASLSCYLQKDIIVDFSDSLLLNYVKHVLQLAQLIGHIDDSTLVTQMVINILAERHMLDVDQAGYFSNMSTESVDLLTIIFEIANGNHLVSYQIFSLYKPLLLTLQDRGEDIESRSYLLYYTYVLYCDSLIELSGRNKETHLNNLLDRIIYNIYKGQNITYVQRKYIELTAMTSFLKLASISSEYYRTIITEKVHGFRNFVDGAILSVSGLSAWRRVTIAMFYFFSYKSGLRTWNSDNYYLELAINCLNEIEKDGGVNVNSHLVNCFIYQIRWYKQKSENEKVEYYQALIRKRLYDNNNHPRWDIPPYIWKEVEELV